MTSLVDFLREREVNTSQEIIVVGPRGSTGSYFFDIYVGENQSPLEERFGFEVVDGTMAISKVNEEIGRAVGEGYNVHYRSSRD